MDGIFYWAFFSDVVKYKGTYRSVIVVPFANAFWVVSIALFR